MLIASEQKNHISFQVFRAGIVQMAVLWVL